MWWTRLCSVSLFAGLASWIRGLFSGGLDVRKACLFVHHESYDHAYRTSHVEEIGRLFPLHNKCNAGYDMVPAWVNTTVVACAVISLAALAVLLWFGATQLVRRHTAHRPAQKGESVLSPS
ncbi:hypothetical protein [Streptomyces sp. NPDC053427]|uniref:hypothetical protein n=1 Tax=Streptomyces sp. NPDC053427 TaxID=3365701 RepID=UPI0037D26470